MKVSMLSIYIGLLFLSINAYAIESINTRGFSKEAIRGYDTVAYFIKGKAIKGNAKFSTVYQEATWLFESQSNLDLFVASPEKYAPQYGGYCAYAIARNTTASIRPELFTIYKGKLYLNFNNGTNNRWIRNKEKFIKKADANWPKMLAH